MLKAIIRIGLLGALLLGNFPIIAQSLGHSTDSHDASIAYTQGWQAIMDYGQYTQSEVYFREALAHDPDFLLAACQVARLSKDSLERVQLLDQVQAGLGSVPADEQALLANFVELMILTNLRESSTATQAEISAQAQKALRLAEENLRGLVRKYKDEVYYISEYIEVINYNHGPQAALDTLADMDHTRLLNAVPFLMGYRAQLYADLGKTAKADEYLYQLKQAVPTDVPKYYVVAGILNEKEARWAQARTYVERALELDPGNIDAQRLQLRLDGKR